MLDFNVSEQGENTVVDLGGRLDAITVEEFDEKIKPVAAGTSKLVLDLAKLEYISSAGLRSILVAGKIMDGNGGSLVIRNTPDEIMQVFQVTGLVPALTFE